MPLKKKEAKGEAAKATEKLTSAYISYVRVILLSFLGDCVCTQGMCTVCCDATRKANIRKSKKAKFEQGFAVGRMMGRSLSH
jgi:hypothetical protein